MARGIALSVALNQVDPSAYPGVSDLGGCHNDAASISRLASARGFQVRPAIQSREATRRRVIGEIESIAGQLESGDIFLLHYSGHGSQVRDAADDEPDGRDETLCLYDAQLIDDELVRLWAKFRPGVRVLFLSDSCHSGSVSRAITLPSQAEADRSLNQTRDVVIRERRTGTRDGDLDAPNPDRIQLRTLTEEQADAAYSARQGFYETLHRDIGATGRVSPNQVAATVLLISGCSDNETSKDIGSNGAFTKSLIDTMGPGFSGTYKAFAEAIRGRISNRYQQNPRLSMIGAVNFPFAAQSPFTINPA